MVTNFDYLNHFWMMKMSNKMKIDGIIFKGLVLSFFNWFSTKKGWNWTSLKYRGQNKSGPIGNELTHIRVTQFCLACEVGCSYVCKFVTNWDTLMWPPIKWPYVSQVRSWDASLFASVAFASGAMVTWEWFAPDSAIPNSYKFYQRNEISLKTYFLYEHKLCKNEKTVATVYVKSFWKCIHFTKPMITTIIKGEP